MLPLQFFALQQEVSWDARGWSFVLPGRLVLFIVLALVALLVFVSRNRTKA
jgi:hypothetical protein